MENDNLFNDDFLRKLIQKTPLDEPSDDFVKNVMANIRTGAEFAPARKPFYIFLKSSWLYIVLSLAVLVFLFSSDLPFTNILPGKGYFIHTLLPYFESMFSGFKNIFAYSKFTSISLMIVVAGGLLYLFDRLISRRAHARHHYSA